MPTFIAIDVIESIVIHQIVEVSYNPTFRFESLNVARANMEIEWEKKISPSNIMMHMQLSFFISFPSFFLIKYCWISFFLSTKINWFQVFYEAILFEFSLPIPIINEISYLRKSVFIYVSWIYVQTEIII